MKSLISLKPYDLAIEIDEVASSIVPDYKKSAIPVGMTDFLELPARFELATRFHEIIDFMEALRPRD